MSDLPEHAWEYTTKDVRRLLDLYTAQTAESSGHLDAIREAQRFADAAGPPDALLAQVRRILWKASPDPVSTHQTPMTADEARIMDDALRKSVTPDSTQISRCGNRVMHDKGYPVSCPLPENHEGGCRARELNKT